MPQGLLILYFIIKQILIKHNQELANQIVVQL